MTHSTPTGSRSALDGIELVVFDMAGTTVSDDGVVEAAFQRAAERTGVVATLTPDEALAYVRTTMGMSKIDVFTRLADGDVEAATRATAAFETAYAELIEETGAAEIPGAEALIRSLLDGGVKVALTTGFAPVTRDAILRSLGWLDLVDVALSPVDAGRGRPAPDLVLAAALRSGVSAMSAVAVVGDTASDIRSGLSAAAGLVVGVLSGSHDEATLDEAGAHAVIRDVTLLPSLTR
ncbi:phosphonatase-like hydrolase [Conyzicola nivalis]|uniref:Haloacid dehalogenase-like hydrolase n=1 Tax=Conyzicola nivalis TaxID=1477021 RepID=A0A916SKI1_9MICO|nr:HAD family hydrolase [Conyzicola nivalis]GGB04548.1 putative haloacid dehalogenase-like hydrolase [Conyzicola nivalis]